MPNSMNILILAETILSQACQATPVSGCVLGEQRGRQGSFVDNIGTLISLLRSMESPYKRLGAASVDQSSGTVVFNVGGQHFEVMQQMISAQPSILLAHLLGDCGTHCAQSIFVEASLHCFQYFLEWYCCGGMFVPAEDWLLSAVLRDARFF